MNFSDKAKAFGFEQAVKYLEKDPVTNIPKLAGLVDRFLPKEEFAPQREAVMSAIEQKDNWYQLIMKIYELDAETRITFFRNFILNENFFGWPEQERNREKYGCNIPWAILLDPTSACNLKCTGCWAAEYGHKLNLSYEDIDSIIEQGKALGTYLYIYTGGEPLVRKKDLIRLCEKHSDCMFLCFTNSTLIDEEFCKELLRVKNFIPSISLEGFEEANDSRRGEGVYAKVMNAMRLLKENKLPFGLSVCYTSVNWDDVSSEAFYDQIIEMGALFVWFFHYMPVGQGAVTDLMVTPEQRVELRDRIRALRKTKAIFSMDFQNDAQYVGGCIAGGRRYLHINAAGDVDPCVFIHYSNANIHDCTLLEALQSPIFMAYHDGQPFNDNMLRPCPMLENPEFLPEMVKKSGAHSTDLQSPESAEELCARTAEYAKRWAPVSEQLWHDCGSCAGCAGAFRRKAECVVNPYQIITDATADMDWKLWDVVVIPMEVRLNERVYLYGPNGTIRTEDFYQEQQTGGKTSTSQISPAEFQKVFEEYLSQGKDVLYLGFSSGMSGTFQNASLIAAELRERYPHRKIACVDTLAASVLQGYLVYEAARKKAEGIPLDELAVWVTELREKACCWFMVDDLATLKRGGRISPATAFIGTALKIKPILEINDNGCLQVIDKKRGRNKSIQSLLGCYQNRHREPSRGVVVVGHGNCLKDAQILKEALQEQYPNTEVILTDVGPVIGAHTGAGMLAIAFS